MCSDDARTREQGIFEVKRLCLRTGFGVILFVFDRKLACSHCSPITHGTDDRPSSKCESESCIHVFVVSLCGKVGEEISGQYFNSGHALHRPSHSLR